LHLFFFCCNMCNILQHTETHCNTLQHTATHCNTLHHTAPHCNTLQHTTPHCPTLQHTATHRNTLSTNNSKCCRLLKQIDSLPPLPPFSRENKDTVAQWCVRACVCLYVCVFICVHVYMHLYVCMRVRMCVYGVNLHLNRPSVLSRNSTSSSLRVRDVLYVYFSVCQILYLILQVTNLVFVTPLRLPWEFVTFCMCISVYVKYCI